MINFLYRDESYLGSTLFASVTRVLWLLFLFSAFHYQLDINFKPFTFLISTSVVVFFFFYILDHEQPSERVTPEQAEHVEPSLAADTSTGTIVVFFYFVIDFGVFFCIKKMDNGRFV